MVRVYNYICFPNFGLLFPVHQVIRMNVVVDWSLIYHHGDRLSRYDLRVLTVRISGRSEANGAFFRLILLLGLVGSRMLLVSIYCVVLMLLVLAAEAIAPGGPRYFVGVWLLLELLLR